MSKRKEYRDFLDQLIGMNMLDYGASISRKDVHLMLDIKMPEVGTLQQFQEIQLIELAAIDYVRNYLLGHGKYITGTTDGYRVLLPSENAKQIELYISSADRKLSRALKLSKSTPKPQSGQIDQTTARIIMKKHGISERFA